VLVTLAAAGWLELAPAWATRLHGGFWNHDRERATRVVEAAREAQAAGSGPALVFSRTGLRSLFWLNSPLLDSPVLAALDLGSGNLRLRGRHPGRAAYLEDDGRLTPLDWSAYDDELHRARLDEAPGGAARELRFTRGTRFGGVLYTLDQPRAPAWLELEVEPGDTYEALFFLRGRYLGFVALAATRPAPAPLDWRDPPLERVRFTPPVGARARGFDAIRLVGGRGDAHFRVGSLTSSR
jgi:hypothetical protein